jgi:polar amino acid transport system ATP-binding protein/general L-amino acid transport system ATP-binding protein
MSEISMNTASGVEGATAQSQLRDVPAVRMEAVYKHYGDFTALDQVDLKVAKGEKIVVCGPSGSGKSTLIRCINHIEKHDEGLIYVNGVELDHQRKNIDAVRRDTGMVFQSFNLFPHMTVLENCILAPMTVNGMSEAEAKDLAMHFLTKVRIPDQAEKFPGQLSGGQQQRVAIARAIAGDPKLVLADEPTGNLDSLMARQVMDLLERINEMGTTIIMVTHDPELARRAHRNVQVVDGQISDFKPYESHAVPAAAQAHGAA